jgi:hypothetical protein
MVAIRHEVWVQAEPRVGSITEFDHELGEPFRMRVIDLVPDERLVWRCVTDVADPGNPASDWLGHRLSFALGSATDRPSAAWMASRLFGADSPDGITVLDFRHSGWTRESRWSAFCNSAWGVALNGLKQYCEAAAGSA